jgi:hypothetical protein
MARQFTIDNLGIDPQTLWWRCPAGYDVRTTNTPPKGR